MNIYESTTTDFDNNGKGYLTDCLSAKVMETLNGDFILSIEYPLNGNLANYLIENNIIKSNVGNENYQLFRIKYVQKTFKTILVTAYHITYDLNDNLVEDCAPTNKTSALFGQYILDHTNFIHPFTFESTITGIKTARYVRKNPIECIVGDLDNSMVKLFGGELLRDNFKLKLLSRRGIDNKVKLMIGKNIQDINITTDITNLYTRIMPIGYDGLKLPEKYVDSPLIENYPSPKICVVNFDDIKYDPDDQEAYQTLDEAYDALRTSANALFALGQDKPLINISINWLELSKTKEYYDKYAYLEKVNLGDTVYVDLLDITYESRIISTTYNVLKDTIETYEVGNYKNTFENTVNIISKKVDDIDPSSILDNAKESATNLISKAMGGYVYKTESELYIMDTDNPSTAQKVWRWNINGLGYSSTGINGPYGIAMTMDGQIVADFITTGTLNVDVIKGYKQLVTTVEETVTQVENNTGNIGSLEGKVNQSKTETDNNLKDINNKFNNYATTESVTQVTNKVNEITTSNAKLIEFQKTITENGVEKLNTKTGITLDTDGMHIDKDGAKTGSTFDEAGVTIIDKSGTQEELNFYSGYVDDDIVNKFSQLESYKGTSLTYTMNLLVKVFASFPHFRIQETYDETHGQGLGVFHTGGDS